MAINLKNDFTYKVSDKGGAIRLTTSGNVAVATAIDVNVREVLLQAADGNASAVRVNLYAAASAALGMVVPAAVTTILMVSSGYLRLSVPSVTAVQFYAAEDGDKVDMIWRN